MDRRWVAYAVPVVLAACGGGGGGGAGGGTAVTTPPVATASPTASPTATASVAPAPSPTASPSYGALPAPAGFAAGTAAAYAVQPDIAACRSGTLKAAVAANVVARLNEIRAFHGLPAIALSSGDTEQAMQAALMMAANGALSHNPPTSWKCYSAAGAAGAQSSNLYGTSLSPSLNYTSDEALLAGWLTEIDNLSVDNVGHRRWLLNPFLVTIAYGRVAGTTTGTTRSDAAALKVFGNAGQNVAVGGLPPFVAYPQGDYPAKYFDTRALLSFTVIADGASAFGANRSVDFSRATVTVTGPNGVALAVSKLAYDNDGYGVANNLQWAVAGLQVGVAYTVAINGTLVRGAATSYSYPFRILN